MARAAIRFFTQEDPIGLAGGLNLYGFAGGDPVNFSDPFGLCPDGSGADGERTTTVKDCPDTDLGNAWRKLGASRVGRGVIGRYVKAGPSVGENTGQCTTAHCTVVYGSDRSVYVSGNSASMAVGLGHEIVHVESDNYPGTVEYVGDEKRAWSEAFMVYDALGSTDQKLSGYGERRALWRDNRGAFVQQINCAVLGIGCQ